MERLVRELKVKALVMVAPPRTLADLRGAFHSDVSVGSSAKSART
jgi:protein required for attachment to host cells